MPTIVEIDAGHGLKLKAAGREDDPYFAMIRGDGIDHFLLQAIDGGHLGDGDILDIGANLGWTASLMAARAPHATVHAYEPTAEGYALLQATIEANGLEGRIVPHNMAVGIREGEGRFTTNPVSTSASHMELNGSGSTVLMTTLDAIAARATRRISFVKMDIEGFEIDALRGGRAMLATHRPTVFLEFNSFAMMQFRDINPRDLLREVRTIFPAVYAYVDGIMQRILDDAMAQTFLDRHIVSRSGMDDLLCTF